MPISVIIFKNYFITFSQSDLDMAHLLFLKTISCQHAFPVFKTKIHRTKYTNIFHIYKNVMSSLYPPN